MIKQAQVVSTLSTSVRIVTWIALMLLLLVLITARASKGHALENPSADIVYVYENAQQGTYSTIQEAIDDVNDGGTVLVGPGTYVENILIRDKAVTILSMAGPETTIIDGNGQESVIRIFDGADVTIDGFTIQNAGGNDFLITSGYGIVVSGDFDVRAHISHNIIENNPLHGGIGVRAGIANVHIEVVIDSNLVMDNGDWTTADRGGITVEVPTSPDVTGFVVIQNNIIASNEGHSGGGLGISGCCAYGAPGTFSIDVINNTVFNNTARYGGGLSANASNLRIFNNIFYLNSAEVQGDDLYLVQASLSAIVVFNDIGDGQFNGTLGNISADPLFVDAASRDFHLSYGRSPCIDAGIAADAPSYDFEGDTRPTGTTADMGADESLGPDLSPSLKSCDFGELQPGSVLTYSVVISSIEEISACVHMTDTIPAFTAYISPSLASTAGQVAYSGNLTDTGTITWTGMVSKSEAVTVTFQVQVLPATESLLIYNTAHIDNGWGVTYERSVIIAPHRLYLPMVMRSSW